jgi:hypothetical protein
MYGIAAPKAGHDRVEALAEARAAAAGAIDRITGRDRD